MADNNLQILMFSLNGEYFATDISKVERIISYEKTTVLPDAPDFIDGVIKHEEKILPIINLNKKFGYEDSLKDNKKVIIVKREKKQFGIIVDNVDEVKSIDLDLLEDVPEITCTVSEKYIDGLIKLDDKIVILLNLSNVLSNEDEQSIF